MKQFIYRCIWSHGLLGMVAPRARVILFILIAGGVCEIAQLWTAP